MKTKFLIICSLILLVFSELYSQQLIKVWESPPDFEVPESVLYDETLDIIFVSNIVGSPMEKDGKGFISKLNPDGKIHKLKWVEGLNAPKGMAIYDGKLFVSDIDQLVEIDISSSKIIKKHHAEGAIFLNDVASTNDGKIFVSDMRTGKIHALNNNKFEVWLDSELLQNPNGLLAENNELFIGEQSIYKVNIISKEITKVIEKGGGIDGLEKDNQGNFVFSHWAGRIFVERDGKVIKVLDSTEQNINTADIDFAKKLNLLLVPTFKDNRVIAYKIQ